MGKPEGCGGVPEGKPEGRPETSGGVSDVRPEVGVGVSGGGALVEGVEVSEGGAPVEDGALVEGVGVAAWRRALLGTSGVASGVPDGGRVELVPVGVCGLVPVGVCGLVSTGGCGRELVPAGGGMLVFGGRPFERVGFGSMAVPLEWWWGQGNFELEPGASVEFLWSI